MRILVTGGGGFLARGMAGPLAAGGHTLRLMDRAVFETPHECVAGDVAVLDDVRRAAAGMDGVVISHMAPREPNAYATPDACFRINVTGTANILFAAQELGVKKVVIISSTGRKPGDAAAWLATLPIQGEGLYGATKECQEVLGQHYAREHGMQIALLRVGYIVDADVMKDKYGRAVGERNALDVDRRDIGEVARLCLEQNHAGLRVLPVMSTRESFFEWGVRVTVDTLSWTPRFDFDALPSDQTQNG
ncbi:MAG: NAD(P)-dependent oxidoreductase [Lentisphaerae bacterium]|nr:NAD(P)-dependent oxidoreductase [Lentisphaerota bacterium]